MMLNLAVSTQMTAEQLWRRWETLRDLGNKISTLAKEKGEQWDNATDQQARTALWADLENLWREYHIVSAWTSIAYAAHTFLTEGTDSVFMSQNDLIGLQVDRSQSYLD